MNAEWIKFQQWLNEKSTLIEGNVSLYDFMGMINTINLVFLTYYYHPEKPYMFRTDLRYRTGILSGPANGLARIVRRDLDYYTVPSIFKKSNSVVFTIHEWEFDVTILFNELFITSDFLYKEGVKISSEEPWFKYKKEDIIKIMKCFWD